MRGGVVARAAVFGAIMYVAIAVMMGNVVQAYFSSGNPKELAGALGVDLTTGSVDVNSSAFGTVPQPSMPGIPSELAFLAPLLSILDQLKNAALVAFAPVALMFLPDYIVPSAVKIFVLLPVNILVFIGILAAIRGYDI